VLPLLTLYQYWATCVCRDVAWTVDCRITRLEALTDASLLADAIRLLHVLMTGDRLPQPLTNGFRSTGELSGPAAAEPAPFNTALPLVEETNMTVCDSFVTAQYSLCSGPHGDPHGDHGLKEHVHSDRHLRVDFFLVSTNQVTAV